MFGVKGPLLPIGGGKGPFTPLADHLRRGRCERRGQWETGNGEDEEDSDREAGNGEGGVREGEGGGVREGGVLEREGGGVLRVKAVF